MTEFTLVVPLIGTGVRFLFNCHSKDGTLCKTGKFVGKKRGMSENRIIH